MNPSSDPYVQQIVQEIVRWAISDALWGIGNLVHSFGESTEPDFIAVVPVYDRILAISLLILGAVIAFAIIERILSGQQGVGLAVVPRVLVCVFFAYTGLSIVQYVTGKAALLSHAWDKDLAPAVDPTRATGTIVSPEQIHLNVVALICMALLISFLALVVYLELIVRAALVLTITAFVPLVCVLAIWPRMASGAVHLAEFLVGLLLSKFVVATAFVVGLSLLLPAVLGEAPNNGKADWMASGFAVLLITAISPVALFAGIRFAHGGAGNVARSWGSMAIATVPVSSMTRRAGALLRPLTAPASKRVASFTGAAVNKVKAIRMSGR